jgi:hypothetical protein
MVSLLLISALPRLTPKEEWQLTHSFFGSSLTFDQLDITQNNNDTLSLRRVI